MLHSFLALLSLLCHCHAVSIQLSSGFIGTASTNTKKQHGCCFRLPRHRTSPSKTCHAIHHHASAISAKKATEAVEEEKRPKKRKTPSTKRRKATTEPIYWYDESDPFVIVSNDGEVVYSSGDAGDCSTNRSDSVRVRSRKSIKFTIRGNPRVLIRHRTARGFMYNPSRKAQETFRDCLLNLLPRNYHPTILDDDDTEEDDENNLLDAGEEERQQQQQQPQPPQPAVLFSQHEFLKMSIVFRMKRPKSHFVSNKPGPGRLKPTAPGKLHSTRSDVDNLAKFVMDSLNGLLYDDDRQVIHLDVMKVMDSEDLCRGATDVTIYRLEEEDFV